MQSLYNSLKFIVPKFNTSFVISALIVNYSKNIFSFVTVEKYNEIDF